MTKEQKIIRAKVGLLELAKQLGNVSQASRSWGTAGTASTAFRSCTTLSQDTARLMVFKLVMAAAKTWRRLKGETQLPKGRNIAGLNVKTQPQGR